MKRLIDWIKPAPSIAKFNMLLFVSCILSVILNICLGMTPIAELALAAYFGLSVLYNFVSDAHDKLKKENAELKNTIDTLSSVIAETSDNEVKIQEETTTTVVYTIPAKEKQND